MGVHLESSFSSSFNVSQKPLCTTYAEVLQGFRVCLLKKTGPVFFNIQFFEHPVQSGSMVQGASVKPWRSLVPISNRTDRLATVFPRGSDERNKMEKLNTNNRSDRSRVNKFLRFIRSRPFEENRQMWSIPIEELAPYLAKFFSTVKAHSGEEFSEGSLVRLRTSLERHLKEHSYPGTITFSPGFEITRQAFKEKQQMLKNVAAYKTAIPTTDISEQLKTGDLSSLIADSSKDL